MTRIVELQANECDLKAIRDSDGMAIEPGRQLLERVEWNVMDEVLGRDRSVPKRENNGYSEGSAEGFLSTPQTLASGPATKVPRRSMMISA